MPSGTFSPTRYRQHLLACQRTLKFLMSTRCTFTRPHARHIHAYTHATYHMPHTTPYRSSLASRFHLLLVTTIRPQSSAGKPRTPCPFHVFHVTRHTSRANVCSSLAARCASHATPHALAGKLSQTLRLQSLSAIGARKSKCRSC